MSGAFLTETYAVRQPRPSAILAGFDGARAFAGEVVFERDGNTCTIPAAASQWQGGRYLDVIQFLHGYGSQATLSDHLDGLWTANTGGGSASVGIDDDDRFYVQCSAFFDLIAGPSNPLGFAEGSHEAQVVGGAYRCTATLPWSRGAIDCRTPGVGVVTGVVAIDPAVGTTFYFPNVFRVLPDLPTAMRGAEADDDDATTLCLEAWDPDANVRWGVDLSGRVFYSSTSLADPITWPATAASRAFRAALGFTGAEVETVANGRTILTATYPCPGVLTVRRVLAAVLPEYRHSGAVGELPSGSVRGRTHGTATQWECRFLIGGSADARNDEGQMLRTLAPLLTRGARVSVFPVWGDPRRGKSVEQLYTGEPLALYGHSHTTQLGGVAGRITGRVSPDSPDAFRFVYSGDLRIRSEHTLIVRESD